MARVLIIDDEEEFRRVVAHVLKSAGHETWEAADGRAGSELFQTIQPDVVLLDVWMPEQDGIETLRKILTANEGASVIVMSGQPTRAGMPVFEVASVLGASSTLVKPFSRGELLEAVTAVLQE